MVNKQFKSSKNRVILDNRTLEIEQIIHNIRDLPDYLMEFKYGVVTDFSQSSDPEKLFKAIRDEYRIKSQWLKVLWLDQTELTLELTKTWKVHYKPFAEQTNAFWDLAKEVHIWLTTHSDINTFPTISQLPKPLVWAFLCEHSLCKTKLENGGYLAKPRPIGKGSFYKSMCQGYDTLEDLNNLTFSDRLEPLSPTQLLEQTASRIAQLSGDFRESVFMPYTATQRRTSRKLERGTLKVQYLTEDGSLFTMDRGRDVRKLQNSSKGFGK